jgi:hypothetical protein
MESAMLQSLSEVLPPGPRPHDGDGESCVDASTSLRQNIAEVVTTLRVSGVDRSVMSVCKWVSVHRSSGCLLRTTRHLSIYKQPYSMRRWLARNCSN